MPSLEQNITTWNETYDWKNQGEEWSQAWGGSEAQWFGMIYPRIHRFIPAQKILEIAPGFGRWTRFLIPSTDIEYVGVDLAEVCIRSCIERFKHFDKASFYKNDGMSLDMVSDNSFDFVFSLDSLVHVEIDVLASYIQQIIRKLTRNGIAFIHHSNWADAGETGENIHYRAESVSASAVAKLIQQNNGVVIIQELINWGSLSCIDCFSVFCRNDRSSTLTPVIINNKRFSDEISIIHDSQSYYSHLEWDNKRMKTT